MSSRYYRPLEEDANDPRYDQSSPFDGDPAAYDTPDESPFTPPSVEASKATAKGATTRVDPFADNPDDPRVQRLHDLDKQLAGRSSSIGGIISAFSPQGDKGLQSLMAQRHMLGNEYHGDQQLRRQMASSQMAQDRAFAHDTAIRANAERNARARENAAQTRVGGQIGVQGLRNEGALATQGLRNEGSAATQGVRNQGAMAVQGLRNSGAANVQGMRAPAKAVADPLVQMQARQLDAAIKAYDKALTADATGEKPITGSTASDKFSNDNKRAILQQKRDELAAQLANLHKRSPGLTPPSAAPSTAPSVHASQSETGVAGPDGGIFRGGNKGKDATGKVYYEQPDGSYVADDGTPFRGN